MNSAYPTALSSFRIGPVEVRNRIFMPAHGTTLVVGGPQGTKLPSDDFAYYFAERAAGGTGLLVHSLNTSQGTQACPFYEESIPSFQAVAELVHAHGARLFGQLWAATSSSWEPLSPMRPVVGPSAGPVFNQPQVRHELGASILPALVDCYVRSARNLVTAGYDGIEIHVAHGQILEQFLSPHFNQRQDAYGATSEGRLRIVADILRGVRSAAGKELAVGIRVNCDEMLPDGLDQGAVRWALSALAEEVLIDFADLDSGLSPQQSAHFMPPHFGPALRQRAVVEAVGRALRGRVAVLTAPGRLTSLAEAEELLAAGVADMVGAVRGLIAEPELVNNASAGRHDRNRVCIACNVCLAVYSAGNGSYCAINPATGRERRWGITKAVPVANPGKVVVVGGGPAGLEAARVSALLGHSVTLFERASVLGGQLQLWARLPDRGHLGRLVAWYEARLGELGVRVLTSREATPEAVMAETPDAVIVGTGSEYSREGRSGASPRPIQGWELDCVTTPEHLLAGAALPSGRVVVVDDEGLHAGPGLAELLSDAGAEVELVTGHLQIAANLVATLEYGHVLSRLRARSVTLSTQSRLDRIVEGYVVIVDNLSTTSRRVPVDQVVLATRRTARLALAGALEGVAPQVFTVGDALGPRGLSEATFEGQRFARLVNRAATPRTSDEAIFEPPEAAAVPRPAAVLGLTREA